MMTSSWSSSCTVHWVGAAVVVWMRLCCAVTRPVGSSIIDVVVFV